MANTGNKSGGSKPTGSRAKSVGAAGHMSPNGAILNTDDAADFLMRRKNFDDWKKNRKALKPNKVLQSMYDKTPSHAGMKD